MPGNDWRVLSDEFCIALFTVTVNSVLSTAGGQVYTFAKPSSFESAKRGLILDMRNADVQLQDLPVYHVTSRGNARADLFLSQQDSGR